jgi:trimeric autotransporter adhesin
MGIVCLGLMKRGEVKVQGLIQGMVVGLVLTGSVWGQAVPPVLPPAPADAQSTSGTPATTVTTPAPAATTSGAGEASGGTISGTVKAGAVPLPGVAVTASNTLTGKKYATTTDVNGTFAMTVPRNGRYVVKAELAAFAADTKEVLINAAGQNGGKPTQVAEFGLQLASRVQQQEERQATATSAGVARGLQALSVTGDTSGSADATASGGGAAGAQVPTLSGLGGSEAAASDSVTVNGAVGQTNGLAGFSEDDVRERIQDAIAQAQRQGGAVGDIANSVAGMLGGMAGGGGFGGGGGGRGFGGGGGGGGGRGGGGGGGGFRGFNPTQPHGAIFYQGGNGALDATNFSLTGAPVVKPDYSTNRFGVSFTGSPFIPGLVKASTKQFIFLNVTGQRNTTPTNLYGTVPTLAERDGDFSGLTNTVGGVTTPVTLYNPATGQPFVNNQVPVSSQAAALLNYYPAPNIPTTGRQGYNYQTITTAGNNATTAALRYVRNFGQSNSFGGGRRQQQGNGPATLRQNINFNGSYSHSAADNRNIFLPLGGTTETDGYGVTAGYTIGYGKLTNNASINWNRSHATARNYFTNGINPLNGTGITVPKPVIGGEPGIYNGLPSVGISNYTGLTQALPSDVVNQTISFSDFVSYRYKKHNMRYGLDIRRVHADSVGGTNVVGSFTFTGYATQNPASSCTPSTTVTCPVLSPSGYGLADFLLGLPQQSTIQAATEKTYLRASVFDWYAQDDWRVLANLTLNYGLRYEYFSPYVEKDNRLVNLDHNSDFSVVIPVCPVAVAGACGTGAVRSLVNPDRNMYSPRVGFAYRPKLKVFKDTVVRGGYGINFNTGQYATLARNLSSQVPFALTQTNVVGQTGCSPTTLTLANGFDCSTTPVQNNYAANLDYRLGHVQVWNLDIQRTFPLGIVANIGYNGAKGGELDIVRAPNRTASGVLNPGAQPFNYEDSQGFSRFEQLSVNVRKRLQKGVSLQATYHYGHSIDNASSIGGTTVVPAQNDMDLNAEEGNSSFDVRQQVTGNWVLELPFGPNRAFLTKGGFWSKALDGFSLSGDFTFASGTYFTPHYVSTVAETATGTNNTLRPDRVSSQPISGQGTILDWFNTAAFAAPPPNQYGTASRGSIEGPGIAVADASLSRTVALGETRSFEMRVTATNVFNTVQYSGIDSTLNSQTFGQVTSAASMRRLTVLARYRF